MKVFAAKQALIEILADHQIQHAGQADPEPAGNVCRDTAHEAFRQLAGSLHFVERGKDIAPAAVPVADQEHESKHAEEAENDLEAVRSRYCKEAADDRKGNDDQHAEECNDRRIAESHGGKAADKRRNLTGSKANQTDHRQHCTGDTDKFAVITDFEIFRDRVIAAEAFHFADEPGNDKICRQRPQQAEQIKCAAIVSVLCAAHQHAAAENRCGQRQDNGPGRKTVAADKEVGSVFIFQAEINAHGKENTQINHKGYDESGLLHSAYLTFLFVEIESFTPCNLPPSKKAAQFGGTLSVCTIPAVRRLENMHPVRRSARTTQQHLAKACRSGLHKEVLTLSRRFVRNNIVYFLSILDNTNQRSVIEAMHRGTQLTLGIGKRLSQNGYERGSDDAGSGCICGALFAFFTEQELICPGYTGDGAALTRN